MYDVKNRIVSGEFMKGSAKVLNLSATKELIPKQRKEIDC